MEKLLAMKIASELTVAACGVTPCPPSPDLKDNVARAKNLQVWETYRAFYAAVIAALADDTDWPRPTIAFAPMVQEIVNGLKPLVPGLLASVGPLLTGAGPLAPVAGQVTALLGSLVASKVPALAGLPPLPSPGQPFTLPTAPK